MVLNNWLATLGHGFQAPADEGGDGGGGSTATIEEEDFEDGIPDDMGNGDETEVDTSATRKDDPEEEYGDVDPIHEERERAAKRKAALEESADDESDETEQTPAEDEQSPSETEASNAPVAETAEFPPDLVEQAGQLGFKYDDLKRLGTTEALQTAVDLQRGLLQQAYDYQQSQLPPPEAAPSKTAELRERLQKMYDEGDIDENSLSVSTAILDQNDQLGQQQAELQRNAEAQQAQVRQYAESLQTKYEQQEARSQANLLMDWFDTQVMALPKSYEATLGAGSSRELSPTSPAYQARDGVMKAVNTYQRNWEDLGYKSDNDPKIFQDALHKQLGDHAKTTARDNLKDELRKNGRRVTARPTHTDSEPTDRRERALENADNHRLFSRRD